MRAVLMMAGLALGLAGCAAPGSQQYASNDPSVSCPSTPSETTSGYFLGCAYYPGYGWAPRPVPHGSAPGTSF